MTNQNNNLDKKYPPLPEPYLLAHEDAGACYPDTFSASQMREYFDLGRKAAPAAVAGPSEHLQWTPGPNEFKDWCAQWFGPDSDDTYLAKAVHALPPMAQRFERSAAPALEAPAAPALPLKATPEMRAAFRRAYRECGFWGDRIDYALDQMLAAAPQEPAAPAVDAPGLLLTVIQRLNQNPYSLTKSECIREVQAMREAAIAAQAAAKGERDHG